MMTVGEQLQETTARLRDATLKLNERCRQITKMRKVIEEADKMRVRRCTCDQCTHTWDAYDRAYKKADGK